jgi:hypothetical protein
VTWDWGVAGGSTFNLLYGAVYTPDDTLAMRNTGAPRVFVALVDSLGVRQILRARDVRYVRPAGAVPESFSFVAARDEDSVRVAARIQDAQMTRTTAAGMGRRFFQMRGTFTLEGRVDGVAVEDSGSGFFETWSEKEK